MKELTKEIDGVTWTLRALSARDRLNAQAASSISAGDAIIAGIARGIVAGSGLDIPKDVAAREEWADEYFSTRMGTLAKIMVELSAFSGVGAEGKGSSESPPPSSPAT